jgi:hypothetical protein
MIAHTHHYVPQWLQRRFLVNQDRYFYRDLTPERFTKPNGTEYTRRATNRWGPKKCFAAEDLYAVNFPGYQSDIVEKEFFGVIDDQAAKSIDFFVSDVLAPHNDYYGWFLRYLSIQKMRTPKGLDWLRSFGSYAFGPIRTPEDLMTRLRQIGEMHITTWAESVWEVVEASAPDVGFILTDSPVTVYNLKAYPGSRFVSYPLEPPIELLGSRTIFPLDSRHSLILSNQEFVENPSPTSCLRPRSNPRSFASTFFSPLHIVRGRSLTADEVRSINFILKKRALRYIAAQREEWLDPECELQIPGWASLDALLQPQKVTFIKSIRASFSDGQQVTVDRLGRPITDPEALAEMEEIDRQIGNS